MRVLSFALVISVSVAFGSEPAARSLTSDEAKALRQPTALGERILAQVSRYRKASEGIKIPLEFDVLTRAPTIDVLRAAGYITESDMTLAHRYQATLQPVPANARPTHPLLTMETERGELIFDTRGEITLRQHR
jgi:hypothetical protein